MKQKAKHKYNAHKKTREVHTTRGMKAISGQSYEPDPHDMVSKTAPKPEVTNKTSPSKTGVRGAQTPQPFDNDRKNRGAVKPWKPKGRK